MRRLVLLVLGSLPCHAQWKYPATRKVVVTDTYFGKAVKDSYRWMENLEDPETRAWFRKQTEMADGLLAEIPGKNALALEWRSLDRHRSAVYSTISCEQGRVFFKKTGSGENVGKLYCREGWDGPDRMLFDPETYNSGAATSITRIIPSFDGRRVALCLSSGGAEYGEIRVLDVASGKLLSDKIYPSFGPIGWTPDNAAFFYDAGKVTDLGSLDIKLNRKTRIHRLGAKVSKDRDFFSNESSPELGISAKERPVAFFSDSFPDYVIGNVVTVQNEMRIFYAPIAELGRPTVHWKTLCSPSDNLVRGMALFGDQAYALTHAGAPNYRMVRTSLAKPDWPHGETVVPETSEPILSVTQTRDFIFIIRSNGISGKLLKYEPATGRLAEISLPGAGTLHVSCPDTQDNRCLVSISSWVKPTAVYDFDGARETFSLSRFSTDAVYPGFEDLVAEEVEVPGHDGALIPLSIIHRRDLVLDGNNSCILDGYGAYGAETAPGFSIMNSIALHGVVLAHAHPRGGGEKGEAWYKGGFQVTKPNTWKDYISCAEYLVRKGYTSPQRLGGTGTSAGGILISRAITERPDLFGAAVCNVGCANALRLEFTPNGPVNTPEFGTVSDPVQAQALYEMDGVQHVRQGVKYPAVLGVGGWNDPRVPPWQPGKFVAALQAANASERPSLMKINYDNGHFTEEKFVTFDNVASQYAFLLWQTGQKEFQPVPRGEQTGLAAGLRRSFH